MQQTEIRPSTKPLIYLAGPYSAPTEQQVWSNIISARELAMLVLRQGGIPITPHLLSAGMGGLVPWEEFLAMDLAIIDRCDAVVLFPFWSQSRGARIEEEHARSRGLPVLQFGELAGFIASRSENAQKRPTATAAALDGGERTR